MKQSGRPAENVAGEDEKSETHNGATAPAADTEVPAAVGVAAAVPPWTVAGTRGMCPAVAAAAPPWTVAGTRGMCPAVAVAAAAPPWTVAGTRGMCPAVAVAAAAPPWTVAGTRGMCPAVAVAAAAPPWTRWPEEAQQLPVVGTMSGALHLQPAWIQMIGGKAAISNEQRAAGKISLLRLRRTHALSRH